MQKIKTKIIQYLIEVLVIIIGILIAFSLDNWNQSRNERKLEKEILSQIKEDLTFTLEDMKNDFIIHQIALQSHVKIDSFLENQAYNTKDLTFDFFWIKEDEYIFPNKTGYEMLESFGTNLITSKEIRTTISYIYNHDFPRITKGNNLFPDINLFLAPYFQKNFKINSDTSLEYILKLEDNYTIKYPREVKLGDVTYKELIGYQPIDAEALATDEEFKFLMSEAKRFRGYKYRIYSNAIDHIEELLAMMELDENHKEER